MNALVYVNWNKVLNNDSKLINIFLTVINQLLQCQVQDVESIVEKCLCPIIDFL